MRDRHRGQPRCERADRSEPPASAPKRAQAEASIPYQRPESPSARRARERRSGSSAGVPDAAPRKGEGPVLRTARGGLEHEAGFAIDGPLQVQLALERSMAPIPLPPKIVARGLVDALHGPRRDVSREPVDPPAAVLKPEGPPREWPFSARRGQTEVAQELGLRLSWTAAVGWAAEPWPAPLRSPGPKAHDRLIFAQGRQR